MELSRSSLTIVQDTWTRESPSPVLARLRERSNAALRHVENENEYASKASTSKGQMEAPLTSNCGSGLALALSQGITRTTLLFSVFI